VKGLVTRGGFIIDMSWKHRKLTGLKVRSTLGGNCRIRINSGSTLYLEGKPLKKANGKNTNSFFDLDEIKKPLIKMQNSLFETPETTLYDLSTTKGKVYEFVVK